MYWVTLFQILPTRETPSSYEPRLPLHQQSQVMPRFWQLEKFKNVCNKTWNVSLRNPGVACSVFPQIFCFQFARTRLRVMPWLTTCIWDHCCRRSALIGPTNVSKTASIINSVTPSISTKPPFSDIEGNANSFPGLKGTGLIGWNSTVGLSITRISLATTITTVSTKL